MDFSSKSPTVSTSLNLEKVNPFRVMTVMHRAAELEQQGRNIVHMEVGEPDFSTPKPIVDAAKKALDNGLTQYTAAAGISELRDSLVQHYRDWHNVELSRERILITPGASGGLTLLANLLVYVGDGILLSDPAYPCVRNFIHLMSAEPQLVPVGWEHNFQPTLSQLDQYVQPNTTGLWLASPSNPTGTIIKRDLLKSTCAWARGKGLHVLVDEIYQGLHYVEDMPSVLELDQNCFVVNSFSKYFGMTGWRLGWIVVPESIADKANVLAQNLYISASSIAQYAALAAFTQESKVILKERRDEFRKRRDYLTTELEALGFKLPEQIQGAFYVYADISKFSCDSEQFCADLLEKFDVASTPGSDFGDYQANQFVRFAFTTSMKNLEIGVERLRAAVS